MIQFIQVVASHLCATTTVGLPKKCVVYKQV